MFDDPEICQAVILDAFRRPKNEGRCENATGGRSVTNPRSGVELEVSIELVDGAIRCARFDGGGCSVSTASASLLVRLVEGKEVTEARALVDLYREMMDPGAPEGGDWSQLGRAEALKMVRGLPDRRASGILAADLLTDLLDGKM